tara:strand:+ start:384 stop:803 length:420 start_codon:yes stop_codon:yes gene_type:complete
MNWLEQIVVTPLQHISVPGGDVLHGMKATESSFQGFGEAYFSWIEPGVVKAWKRHLQMTMNLIAPVGRVRFVFHDPECGYFREESIGESNYCRLTVPPKIWFGFQGMAAYPSLLLNLASTPHAPEEVERTNKEGFHFCW